MRRRGPAARLRGGFRSRGFTLIEVIIAVAISVLMVTMALLFITQETRLLTRNREELSVQRSARAAVSFLSADLRRAGAGLGYSRNGLNQDYFLGLRTGGFRTAGFTFEEGDLMVGFVQSLTPPTTIARVGDQTANGLTGFSCLDLVRGHVAYAMISDADGLQRVLGRIPPIRPVMSNTGACNCAVPGALPVCHPFEVEYDMDFSGVGVERRFVGGEVVPDPMKAVWFIGPSPVGDGTALRRYQGTYSAVGGCDGGRDACGSVVSYDIEDFNFRVSEYIPLTGWREVTWVNVPANSGLLGDFTGGEVAATTNRLRIDIEVIARTEQEVSGATPLLASTVTEEVYPPGGDDRFYRAAFRTTIDVLNTGQNN